MTTCAHGRIHGMKFIDAVLTVAVTLHYSCHEGSLASIRGSSP